VSSGNDSHAHQATKSPVATGSPFPGTPSPSASSSPSEAAPTSANETPESPLTVQGKAKVEEAAQKYHLEEVQAGYGEYPQGTQKYAAYYALPNSYYDLTSLFNSDLTQEDYVALGPILISNAMYAINTANFIPLEPQGKTTSSITDEQNQLLGVDYDAGTFLSEPEVANSDGTYEVTFKHVPARVANLDRMGDRSPDNNLGASPSYSGSFMDLGLTFDTNGALTGISYVVTS
jgi:hypothetical protein